MHFEVIEMQLNSNHFIKLYYIFTARAVSNTLIKSVWNARNRLMYECNLHRTARKIPFK